MDPIGLAAKVYDAVVNIYEGRTGFATRGMEAEGRISYEVGIEMAAKTFREAQASADPQIIALAEYAFISQELALCPETDGYSLKSLVQARQGFDDAFLALEVVENGALYREASKLFPRNGTYRFGGCPKDAFHIACIAHRTRIQNMLRTPGVDPIEKTLLKQRFANLSTAQNSYIEKQKKALNS